MFDLAILQNDKTYKLNFMLTFKCLGLLIFDRSLWKNEATYESFFQKKTHSNICMKKSSKVDYNQPVKNDW